MNNGSRTPSNESHPRHTILGAVLGALATVVVLTGAVAIAESPRQLSTITESLVSTEVFEFMPSSWSEAPQPEPLAVAPAIGLYVDLGLEAIHNLYA